MEQNQETRNKSKHIWSTNNWQVSQEYSMEKIVSSINGAGKIGQPQQRNGTGPLSVTLHKN